MVKEEEQLGRREIYFFVCRECNQNAPCVAASVEVVPGQDLTPCPECLYSKYDFGSWERVNAKDFFVTVCKMLPNQPAAKERTCKPFNRFAEIEVI